MAIYFFKHMMLYLNKAYHRGTPQSLISPNYVLYNQYHLTCCR